MTTGRLNQVSERLLSLGSLQIPCLDAVAHGGNPQDRAASLSAMLCASGGNHGSAVMGGTPKTALPPQDRLGVLSVGELNSPRVTPLHRFYFPHPPHPTPDTLSSF